MYVRGFWGVLGFRAFVSGFIGTFLILGAFRVWGALGASGFLRGV